MNVLNSSSLLCCAIIARNPHQTFTDYIIDACMWYTLWAPPVDGHTLARCFRPTAVRPSIALTTGSSPAPAFPTPQNVLENYPQFLVLFAMASIKRPTWAAVAGAIRLVGFVLYVTGYRVMLDADVNYFFAWRRKIPDRAGR